MVNRENYFDEIDRIGFEVLPDELKRAYLLIRERTKKGKDWSEIEKDNELHKLTDAAFEKMQELLSSSYLNGIDKTSSESQTGENESYLLQKLYLFQGLELVKEQAEYLLNEIHEAIIKRALRPSSPFTREIMLLQQFLMEAFTKMESTKAATLIWYIPDEVLKHIEDLLPEEKGLMGKKRKKGM